MDPSVNQAPDIGPIQPEAAPVQKQTPENPNIPTGGVEAGPEQPRFGPERVSQPERTSAPAPSAPVPSPTPQPVTPPAQTTAQTDQDVDTPAIAQDVDVIEKEWVNKAREVINKTKDDPYAQEAAFEKLQTEYLKKRYGYGKDLSAV